MASVYARITGTAGNEQVVSFKSAADRTFAGKEHTLLTIEPITPKQVGDASVLTFTKFMAQYGERVAAADAQVDEAVAEQQAASPTDADIDEAVASGALQEPSDEEVAAALQEPEEPEDINEPPVSVVANATAYLSIKEASEITGYEGSHLVRMARTGRIQGAIKDEKKRWTLPTASLPYKTAKKS